MGCMSMFKFEAGATTPASSRGSRKATAELWSYRGPRAV